MQLVVQLLAMIKGRKFLALLAMVALSTVQELSPETLEFLLTAYGVFVAGDVTNSVAYRNKPDLRDIMSKSPESILSELRTSLKEGKQ